MKLNCKDILKCKKLLQKFSALITFSYLCLTMQMPEMVDIHVFYFSLSKRNNMNISD